MIARYSHIWLASGVFTSVSTSNVKLKTTNKIVFAYSISKGGDFNLFSRNKTWFSYFSSNVNFLYRIHGKMSVLLFFGGIGPGFSALVSVLRLAGKWRMYAPTSSSVEDFMLKTKIMFCGFFFSMQLKGTLERDYRSCFHKSITYTSPDSPKRLSNMDISENLKAELKYRRIVFKGRYLNKKNIGENLVLISL
jgi:hypothetical protein